MVLSLLTLPLTTWTMLLVNYAIGWKYLSQTIVVSHFYDVDL